MPKLDFTSQLRRFLTVRDVVCSATVLRQALQQAFETNPRLAGYVLDDQGHLRANVVVFIDGHRVESRATLDDVLGPDTSSVPDDRSKGLRRMPQPPAGTQRSTQRGTRRASLAAAR